MSRTANALVLLLLGFLLLMGFLLMLLPSGSASSAGSVRSIDAEGRRALYLVLEELGYTPRGWTDSPGNLPRAAHVLYLPDTPANPPGYGESEDAQGPVSEPVASTRRLRDPRHYLRFVEEGGTLITPVDGRGHLEFLSETLGLEEVGRLALTWGSGEEEEEEEEDSPQDVDSPAPRAPGLTALLWTGEELEMRWRPSATFDALPVISPFQTMAVDLEGRGLVYSLEVGRGTLVLLAPGDDWLDNANLDEGDNALLLVRLIEEYSRTKRILFDEYALGGWVPDSPIALALSPSTFGFSVHLVLWGLLALWFVVWTRPFARDPEPLGQVSAVARAQGFAGMVASTGSWNLLARMLRAGVMRRLAARVGARSKASAEDDQVPLELDQAEVKRVLELVLHGADNDVLERAHALLTTAKVGHKQELEALGERLAELERMVLVSERQNGQN